MNKKIIAVLLVSVFMLSGCQGKKGSAGTSKASAAVAGSTSADRSNSGSTNSNASSDDKTAGSNSQSSKSGTLPELNSSQKAQVKDELQPVIDNVNSTLKSIEDPKDVNLNSLD